MVIWNQGKKTIVVTPALEKGEVTLEFFDSSGFTDPEEVPDLDDAEAQATVTVSGSGDTDYGLNAEDLATVLADIQ